MPGEVPGTGAWRATVQRVSKGRTPVTEQLGIHTYLDEPDSESLSDLTKDTESWTDWDKQTLKPSKKTEN